MDLLIELKIISYLKINAANPLRDLYININIVHIYCTLIVHFYIDFNNVFCYCQETHENAEVIFSIWHYFSITLSFDRFTFVFRPELLIKKEYTLKIGNGGSTEYLTK